MGLKTASNEADDRTLTQGQLNRALLQRQLLLERADLAIPEALERLCGIQNQYAPNAYIRLWSCLASFRREDLSRAYEGGAAVQGTLMRGTIHTVSAADYRLFAAAVRPALRAWADRIYEGPGEGREELLARVESTMARRSVARAELMALREGVDPRAWATVDVDAELLRVPPSGTWERRRAHTYGLASDWLPTTSDQESPPDTNDALAHLVRRYLGGFGPAAAPDIASFTGVALTPLKQVLARLTLRRFRNEAGRELLDLPDAPLPDPDTPAPVRFLPTWDATLLAHARRSEVLPEEYRPLIFNTKTPHSLPTFLIDGQVAGTWRHEAGRIRIDPFADLSPVDRRAVDEEAGQLADFHAS